MNSALEKLIAHVNRKQWWHVPPVDPDAYKKRGKFFSVSFAAAEFWGRPLDEPERVTISKPLVGDEKGIAKVLGIPPQHDGMSLDQIAAHDARWRKAAGKIPRSLELNILEVSESQGGQNDSSRALRPDSEKGRPAQSRNSAAATRR